MANKSTEKKILGVMGGMGPEATSRFYDEIIKHTKANCDADHIDMIIMSRASTPDRTKAIETGDDAKIIEILRRDAKILEDAGAENIAITCNTSHCYYEQISSAVSIPVINMVDEAVAFAVKSIAQGAKPEPKENGIRIGIMATDGTVKSGIYEKACAKYGAECVLPGAESQKAIMSLIYDDIKAGKPGEGRKFEKASDELRAKACDAVILACTELSVFKGKNSVAEMFCVDAMDVLVKESVIRSGGTYI